MAFRHAERAESLKPTRVKNDVRPGFKFKQGQLEITCSRYKTRLTRGAQVHANLRFHYCAHLGYII